jgi:hypothetical protein
MNTTLSPNPESPGGMDERQSLFATSLVHSAKSLSLREKRRSPQATSLSPKPERLSSNAARPGSLAETLSFFAERRGSNATTPGSIPEALCSIPGALCFIPTTKEVHAAIHDRIPATLPPIAEVIMSAPTKIVHRPRVSLALPRRVPDLISYATRIVADMTNNPSFPSPTPTLAAIAAAIAAVQTAQSAALAKTTGAATIRNEKRGVLVALLQQLGAYIQAVADANPENGASTIQSSGVAVRKTPTHVARSFAAEQGAVSGSVKVTAAVAARRAAYDWEYSVDGGKTWVPTSTTLQAKTTVTGLPTGTTVQFRYRAATKTGAGDWSQPTSLLVK